MTRETKLGIAFIGILLSVFTVLLFKKLSRPSNRGLNAAFAQAGNEPAAPKTLPAAAPTVVTPNNDSSKGAGLIPFNDRSNSTASSTDWSSSSRYTATSPNADSATSVPDNVPGVLGATPLPIQDTGERYSTAATEKPADRYADKAADTSPTSLSYQSAYPATSSDEPSAALTATATPTANTVQVAPIKPVDDIPSRTTESHASDYRSTSTPIGNTTQMAATTQPARDPFAQSSLTGNPNYKPYASSTVQASTSDLSQSHRRTAEPVAPASTAWATATARSTITPTATPSQSYSQATPSQSYSSATMASAIQTQPPGTVGLPRNGEEYEVQPNDSFWNISEKAYGTGAYFKALVEYNRKRNKNRDELKVGQTLLVPDEAVLKRAYPDLSPRPRSPVAPAQQRLVSASSRMRGPGKIYIVAEGDTLFEIARHELGKPARWGEIYELNRELLGNDFDYLRPGTELILPAGAGKTSETARTPESLYSR
jgi:nucleoid-associated protein YgaU